MLTRTVSEVLSGAIRTMSEMLSGTIRTVSEVLSELFDPLKICLN